MIAKKQIMRSNVVSVSRRLITKVIIIAKSNQKVVVVIVAINRCSMQKAFVQPTLKKISRSIFPNKLERNLFRREPFGFI
jgi:predicted transcriptional regulator